MKKPFIFGCGVSFCGTTSLHRTLALNNNYLHTGIEKEWNYLNYIFNSNNGTVDPYTNDSFLYHIELKEKYNNLFKSLYQHKKFIKGYSKICYNTPEYLEVLNKFSLEEINEIFSYPYTLEKYIKYYKLLSQYSEGIFNSVGDFTNQNIILTTAYKDQFEVCKSELEKDFDFKFLMILRDPIRSYFSILNGSLYGHIPTLKRIFDRNNFNTVEDYVIDRALTQRRSFITDHNYAKFIKYVKKNYGEDKIHYVIMEDFFSDNNEEEKTKLEKFLNTKINSVYPCVFVPDKGINSPKTGIYADLKDQWDADREKLSPDLYNFLKKHYQYLYDEFEEMHGYLPADWGRPIDYGY